MMNLSLVTKDNLGMELLPDEILLKIFSYLPTYDNLRRIPLICKRFHKLSRDFTLIKDLYLTKNYDHPSQSKVINETIVESKYLYKLTIFQRTDVEDLILNAVKFCPKLCHLEILYCYCQIFYGLSDQCLSNIVKYGQNLEYLIIDTSLERQTITKPLTELKNLKCFKLIGGTFETSDLISLTNNCHHLETFHVTKNYSQFGLPEDAITMLLKERKSTLKALNIDGGNIRQRWFRNLLICQNLKELGIDGVNNLQKDIALVPISKLHQLTTLNLSNSINVTANGFSLLFRKRNLEFLQNLNLSSCIQVDDSVVKKIAMNCPNLEILNFGQCILIRDKEVKLLIKNCHLIKELQLCGVPKLTNNFLCDINVCLPELLYLNLYNGARIRDSYLKYVISQSDKNLKVINWKGDMIQKEDSQKNSKRVL